MSAAGALVQGECRTPWDQGTSAKINIGRRNSWYLVELSIHKQSSGLADRPFVCQIIISSSVTKPPYVLERPLD